jgi:hypothetical protein
MDSVHLFFSPRKKNLLKKKCGTKLHTTLHQFHCHSIMDQAQKKLFKKYFKPFKILLK